jgi:hypothetical protein
VPFEAFNDDVVDYWAAFYVDGHCTLCGNGGVVDTRGARTGGYLLVGRLNWCICPNGQIKRDHSNGREPELP